MKLFKHIENETFHLATDEATSAPDYQDVTSIKNWHLYGGYTGADYKLINDEIAKYCNTIEKYDALEIADKQITLIRMVAPPGKTMVDPLEGDYAMPLSEHEKCLQASNSSLRAVFKKRDELAFDKVIENVYRGGITMANAQHLCKDADYLRYRYVSSRIEDDTVDSIDGIVDWLKNTGSFTPQAITAVDAVGDIITIARPARIPELFHEIKITGSTGNDGIYTILSVLQSKTIIELILLESLVDSVADGNLIVGGFAANEGYTDAIKDEIASIYEGTYGLTIIT